MDQVQMDCVEVRCDKRNSSLKPRSLVNVTPSFFKEKTYWETSLQNDELIVDMSSIDSLDYNPHDLSQLLVSSLARLSLYDTDNLEVTRTYRCNTQYQIYGGCIRKNDGRLIAAGSEEGKVFVFETNNSKPMRVLNFSSPTHKTTFQNNNLVTFSDDCAVRIIDIGSGQTIRTFGDVKDKKIQNTFFHQDYVRCGHIMDQLIVSGSYDSLVKIWDPRQDHSKPVHEYNHGYAVENLCSRGNKLLVSVGGSRLQVFDMVAGKTLANILPKHHKTITSVTNYEDKYLLTGGLDGFVNVINFNYEYVTRFNFENNQVLAMLANPKLLAVGLNNHNVHIKKFKNFIKKSNDEQAELEKLQSGYFGPHMVTRYFHEAIAESQDPVATRRSLMALKQRRTPIVLDDLDGAYQRVIITKGQNNRSSSRPEHERYLSDFQHIKALESVLKHHQDDPDEVTHILHELLKRDKLKAAMIGCHKLISLMNFICIYLSNVRHNRILLDCATIMLDIMLNDHNLIQHNNSEFWRALERLSKVVNDELDVIDACFVVKSHVDTIISQY